MSPLEQEVDDRLEAFWRDRQAFWRNAGMGEIDAGLRADLDLERCTRRVRQRVRGAGPLPS